MYSKSALMGEMTIEPNGSKAKFYSKAPKLATRIVNT